MTGLVGGLILRAGALSVDRAAGVVMKDDHPIALSPKSLQVLIVLMERAGAVISKSELIDIVWEGRAVSDAAITSAMRELRIALDDDVRSPVFIRTVYGRGYVFIHAIDGAETDAASAPWSDLEAHHRRPLALRPRRMALIVGAPVAALLAIVFIAAFQLGRSNPERAVTADLDAASAAAVMAESDIGVPKDRFIVLVATLNGDDERGTFSRSVKDALDFALHGAGEAAAPGVSEGSFGDGVWIDRLPRTLAVGDAGTRRDLLIAERKARAWLKETGADVLVWGEVVPEMEAYSLRVTSAGLSDFGRYAFEDVRFGEAVLADLAPVVLAAAVGEANTVELGSASGLILTGLEAKLRPLATDPPEIFTREQVCSLRLAYARIAGEFGRVVDGGDILAEVSAMLDRELLDISRADHPDMWARIQRSRAYVLLRIGEIGETEALDRSVEAGLSALEIWTRQSAPLNWAEVQSSIGKARRIMGARGGAQSLGQAAAAFRAALTVLTRDAEPRRWAETQNDLGIVYQRLGEDGQPGALDEAVKAFRAALEVQTLEGLPMDWAITQNNLANALATLGERGRISAFEEAVGAYRAALRIFTRDKAPMKRAMVQNNLADTYYALHRLGRADMLANALIAYDAAMEVWTLDTAPMDWAIAAGNLAKVQRALGEGGDRAAFAKAIDLHTRAMAVETRADAPDGWSWHHHHLGLTYLSMDEGDEGEDGASLSKAIAHFDQALLEREARGYEWAETQSGRGAALARAAGQTGDAAMMEEALLCLETALAVLEPLDATQAALAERRLEQALRVREVVFAVN